MDFMQKQSHIYFKLLDFIRNRKRCVLATVSSAQGSTPQKPGCSAIFGIKGLIAGTVGGGAVELAIGEIASKALKSRKTGYYRFDLDNEITDVEAAICGGGMSILVDAEPEKHLNIFESLSKSVNDRIQGVLVTFCDSGKPECKGLERIWITRDNLKNHSGHISGEIISAAAEMLSKPDPDAFREIFLPGSENDEIKLAFLESIVPLPQLIIAGAGHVGKALSHLGNLLGFDVTVWDDRAEYANKTNLPDAHKILSGSLEESLGNFIPKSDSYIVIVTRGHKKDADVLKLFIGSGAGYIGMIGSRRKVAQVRELFLGNGWATEEEWNRIYSPIGLEIGSKTVQEIAVSIAAQLIEVKNENKKRLMETC